MSTAGIWVNFFKSAGIPPAIAATYAHVFHENRIQMDMLLDLNKEYLREMGITIMGDIIAILRHSRNVYDQSKRDKILSTEKVPVATVSANAYSGIQLNKIDRTVVRSEIATTTNSTNNGNNNNRTLTTSSNGSLQQINKLPTNVTSVNTLKETKNNVVCLNPNKSQPNSGDDTMNLPKQPRRVLPEHEGRYKITLPMGTTPRSKDILMKQGLLPAEKEPGIFERLQLVNKKNENLAIKSQTQKLSSENNSAHNNGQLVIRTPYAANPFDQPKSSIFPRLGNKDYDNNPEEDDDDDDEATNGIFEEGCKSILKSASSTTTKKLSGIVKKPLFKQQKVVLVKQLPTKVIPTTMIADQYEMASKKFKNNSISVVDASKEVDDKEIAPRRNNVQIQNNLEPSIFERLHLLNKKNDNLSAQSQQSSSPKSSNNFRRPNPIDQQPTMRISYSGLDKPQTPSTSSSIFSRLGNKSNDEYSNAMMEEEQHKNAGILKNTPIIKKQFSGIVKQRPPLKEQKVVLVKKIPAKAVTMVADEYDSYREKTKSKPIGTIGHQKSVSFSAEDEVLEFAPRPINIVKSINYNDNAVHSRLGSRSSSDSMTPSPPPSLHKTRQTISFKAKERHQSISINNKNNNNNNNNNSNKISFKVHGSNFKSDAIQSHNNKEPILNRLRLNINSSSRNNNNNNNNNSNDKLIKNIDLKSKLTDRNRQKMNDNSNSNNNNKAIDKSVFNRLGYNKK